MSIKKVDEYYVESMKYPNYGLADFGEKKIEIKNAIPGQRLRVKVSGRRKKQPRGTVLDIISPSPLETQKGCGISRICGGCNYQNLTYENERKLKEEMLKDHYKEIYSKNIKLHPAPEDKYYRNKMEYSFGDREKGGPLQLGLHCRGRYYEIIETDPCTIAPKEFQIIRKAIAEYFREKKIPFYHTGRKEGILRHLVLRKSFHYNEILVNLVTTDYEIEPDFIECLNNLKREVPIHSVYHTINRQIGDVVHPDEIRHLMGKEYITEQLLGLDFRIGPFSFFQPNPIGAENLFRRALEMAEKKEQKTIYDLYSGTGTIGQIFSTKAEKVIGIEIIKEAVAFAKENAILNGIENAEFIQGDVLKELDRLKDSPGLVTIDPPRAGISPKARKKIIDIGPKNILYISCNPTTHKIDIKDFITRGYHIEELECFDQFPKTSHVEAVCLMTRVR